MKFRRPITTLAALAIVATPLAQVVGTQVAHAANPVTYTPGTPVLGTITNGSSAAPWNEWQGDSGTAAYASNGIGAVLPTYTTGGVTTGSGSSAEPNVAVYPGVNSGTAGDSPYPSGVVGTAGPLDGYCGSGNNPTESAGSPVRQPAGTTLPFAPAYFPHVVSNQSGTLTGYFDYRPKDADEALVEATSADNGVDWTYQDEKLEQNPGYCASADINDDGEGHSNVITIQANGNTFLYTLQRAAGDNSGVGMLVHQLTAAGTDTIANLPSSEKVGIDPDAFATSAAPVPFTGGTGATINVNQTGFANSSDQLVPGEFVDFTQHTAPNASEVINCTGIGGTTLTGCTTAQSGGITVASGDLIEQVIATVGNSGHEVAEIIPAGPNNTLGTGGLANFYVTFADNITATVLNNNAPNRIYVDGTATYCSQSNASPTTKIEDCTTGPGGAPVTAAVGDPITSDPVVPATAMVTSGLVAPDGIVGVLPSYPNDGSVPSNATYVMYTEKLLGYYMAGVVSANGTFSASAFSVPFYADPSTTSDLATLIGGTPVTVEIPDDTKDSVVPVQCTGLSAGSGSMESNTAPLTDTLTGCTAPAGNAGDTFTAKDQIGAPGAALESPTTLGESGEGSATNWDKLYKNNEDLTILRVAYTTDGINYSTSGLTNGGVISGQGTEGSGYNDINDPSTLIDPPGGPNAYATSGTADAAEMRWVGSAGTIITNSDGSYGLFLSGAWPADGDSDAFNQVFYSTSTDGEHWSVPVSVVSTDYSFSASVAQDTALAGGSNQPLGISAYYSGRAYGPSVVENADCTYSMIFAGYRLPKTIAAVGSTPIGTNPSAPYTPGATDPTAYRNILSVNLTPSAIPNCGATPEVPSAILLPVVALLLGGGAVVYVNRRRRQGVLI